MVLDTTKHDLLRLVHKHEEWRASCLNLVAAENAMSPLARSLLSTDLAQRYGDYTGRDLTARRYLGTDVVVELEALVNKLAREVFDAHYVELRPISGHVAGDSVIMALCKPGDRVVELGRNDGGHRLAAKLASAPLVDLHVDYLPFDHETFNIDVEDTVAYVKTHEPRLVIVGSSTFLFPIPLRELTSRLEGWPNTLVVYDASHVLGLIAGGQFQEPLKEGAHLVLAGTQKSFPGPQGGVIYSNSEAIIQMISDVVYPAVLSNHHLARLPALGVALLEMKLWGREYATQVVRNSQELARALVAQDVPVVGTPNGYTHSHTVLINSHTLGQGESLGVQLQDAGIIVTPSRLPQALGGASLRLGTSEVTRRGATPSTMQQVARLVADVLLCRRTTEAVRHEVRALAGSLSGFLYTWPDA